MNQKSPKKRQSQDDDVDDLLAIVEGKDSKPKAPINNSIKEEQDGLFDELVEDEVEDDEDTGNYNPSAFTGSRPATKGGEIGEDLKAKRAQLFFGKPPTPPQTAQTTLTLPKGQQQQQQAQFPIPETEPAQNDEIPTINIEASRRQSLRPQTAQNSSPFLNNAKRRQSEFQGDMKLTVHTFGSNKEEKQQKGVFIDFPKSEKQTQKDSTPINKELNTSSQSGVKGPPRLMRTHEETLKETPQGRSFASGQNDDDILFPDHSEKSVAHLAQKQRNLQIQQQKEKEQQANLQQVLSSSIFSKEEIEQQKKIALQFKQNQQEQYQTPKYQVQLDPEFVSKQQDLHYQESKNQIQLLKKHYEEQINMVRDNFEKQLEFERKHKEQIQIESNDMLRREKERLMLVHETEMKNKEQIHEFDLQSQKRKLDQENEILKKQLEAQIRLESITNDIKLNSNKLNSISEKFEISQINQQSTRVPETSQQHNEKIASKEKLILEMEGKIQSDFKLLENEKKILQNQQNSIIDQEKGFREYMDKERDVLRLEYDRLNKFQEQLRQSEQERKMEFQKKENELSNRQNLMEQEHIAQKQEYLQKYSEFELQTSIFEQLKQDFAIQTDKIEQIYQNKIQEADRIRERLAIQENDFIKEKKQFELKSFQFSSQMQDNHRLAEQLKIQKMNIDGETQKVLTILKENNEKNSIWENFKRQFELEKSEMARKEKELSLIEQRLEKEWEQVALEKKSVQNMQQTLQNMKRDVIKDMDSFKSGISFFQSNNVNNQNQISQQKPYATYNSFFPQQDTKQTIQKFEEFEKKQSQINIQQELPIHRKDNQIQKNKQISGQYKPFNINSYLADLQKIQEISSNNQDYINIEKENLFLRKNLNINNNQGRPINSYESSPFIQKPSIQSDF